MNEPQHIEPERIEGEFHYARKVQGDVVFESWMIFRRGDDEEASDYYWRGRDARRIVEALDAVARHFTATAVKEERERVLAELRRESRMTPDGQWVSREASEWRPIATAPKDGTTLALFGRWFGDPEVRIGRWLSSPIDGYDGDWSIEYEPTHYIVIPALPTPLLADPQEQSGSAG